MALRAGSLRPLRLALRGVARQPRVAFFVCFTLAVATAATTIIFTFVNALVLRPLPMAEPSRVVLVFTTSDRQAVTRGGTSLPDYLDWRARVTSFAEMAAAETTMSASLETDAGPVPVRARRVTASFGRAWGLTPAIGRLMVEGDDTPGASPVVVLSDGFWRRQFGADPHVIGRTVRLDGDVCSVIGVMRRSLEIGDLALTDIWRPLPLDPAAWPRARRSLQVTALLRRGVSVQQADAEMAAVSGQLAREYPDSDATWSTRVRLFADAMAVPETWTVLGLSGLAVVLVLLVACANVASLMLARAVDRRRETAVRLALGASRAQILLPMFVEAAVLSVMAAAGGLLLAAGGLDVVRAVTFHPFFHNQVAIDNRVLGFVLAVAVVTPLLFGLGPALTASQLAVGDALQAGGRGLVVSPGTQRARSLLVVAQIAAALALLVVCVLAVQAAVTLQRADLGFEPTRVLTLHVDLPESGWPTPEHLDRFQRQVLADLGRLPAARSVAAGSRIPVLGPQPIQSIAIQGRDAGETAPWCVMAAVSPDYFSALSVGLRIGRTFSPYDSAQSVPVAIVNDEAATRYWTSAERALGQHVRLEDESSPWLEVVGVVKNVRGSLDQKPPGPEIYVPLAQHPERRLVFLLRSESAGDLAAPARTTLGRAAPGVAVYDMRTFDRALDDSLANDRLTAGFFTAFAVVALLLAAIGLYSLIEYSVVRRRSEMAVRVVLGARPADILALVMMQALRLSIAGVVIGLVAAYPLARMLGSAVRGVTGTPMSLYAGVAGLLVAIAVGASYWPARQAMRIDPASAIRSE